MNKAATILVLTACLSISLHGYAQRVTLSQKRASLKSILVAVEKQTGYTHVVDASWLQMSKPVDIDAKDMPLRELLDQCFKDQPLSYNIIDKIITVRPKISSEIRGRIMNERGDAVSNATININNGEKQIVANDDGEFTLPLADMDANLYISSVNYESQTIKVNGRQLLTVQLKVRTLELCKVAVVSNGYQSVPVEEATGSYVKIDNNLLNRKVSANILDRLDGVTSGLAFTKNIGDPNLNQSSISIRGRSTIFANAEPLIVLDNFPYTGDINNINPNDVESITILKDAAAASIWGAFSGNGVIIITTKKGKYNQAPKVSFNTNITIGNKPNLYYTPRLSSSDYIDVEKYLFDSAYYDSNLGNALHPAVSPVVEILAKQRAGTIDSADAAAQINALRNHDVRQDLQKYFYRKSVSQQYAINVSGGGPNNQYYFSLGYDKALSNLVGNENDRITLNANNTYALLKHKVEFSVGVLFTQADIQTDNPGNTGVSYPYLKLVDNNGNALPIPYTLRQSYIDTAGGGQLLDWNYRPLDELRIADNTSKRTDYFINTGLKYHIIPGLDANILFQYYKGFLQQQNLHSQQTYFTRNFINEYTNATTFKSKIPLGGILDDGEENDQSINFRTQANYTHTWRKKHTLAAIGGVEVRSAQDAIDNNRTYGYDPETHTGQPIDATTSYPLYYAPFITSTIPYISQHNGRTDRFISYFINAAYTFNKKYILSASARKDESNIFGVTTNQKGVPLWSVGASWEISKEKFFHVDKLSLLRLRITDGYNGNVDKAVSAFTTASGLGMNSFLAPIATITNPPNPSLRWEKDNMINFGVDFSTKNNRVEGSLEYYLRKGEDLFGESPLDPTTGITRFTGNTANMAGHGFDVTINTRNIDKKFIWYSTILFSHTFDKVTVYKVRQSTIGKYLDPTVLNPLEGKPLYSIYSLRWAGLDTVGDPQALLVDGKVTKDYISIPSSANLNNLNYVGPADPTYFGSFRNTFSWKQFQLSFNITWKFGYYFKRNTINYYDLLNGLSQGHPDYEKRWQKRGDEKTTTVPALKIVRDPFRDQFYTNSDVVVEKGDHIRLQDLQFSYDLRRQQFKKLPIQSIRLYIYANNIGILWRANKYGIDPDYVSSTSIPEPRTLSVGIKVEF